MVYRGTIRNGRIELDDGADLPEGTVVNVEPVDEPGDDDAVPTLFEQLEPLVGSVEGLPPDMAENHDHYLHGRPKQ